MRLSVDADRHVSVSLSVCVTTRAARRTAVVGVADPPVVSRTMSVADEVAGAAGRMRGRCHASSPAHDDA